MFVGAEAPCLMMMVHAGDGDFVILCECLPCEVVLIFDMS